MSLYHWHFQTKMSRSLRLLRQETVTDCNYRQYHRMSNCIGSYNHIIVASTSSSSSAIVFTGATVFLEVNCSAPHWSHLSAGLSLTLIWSANRLMPLALCIYDGGAIEVDRSIEFVTYEWSQLNQPDFIESNTDLKKPAYETPDMCPFLHMVASGEQASQT